jgi:hypothetical protein
MAVQLLNHGQFTPIYRFLSSDGTTSGTKDMSTTADDYYISAPAGSVILLCRMIVYYADGGTWTEATFGSETALTTGIKFGVEQSDDTQLLDLTDGVTIKNNADWSRYCYDSQVFDISATPALTSMSVRWTFEKSGQYLRLEPTDKFVCTISDSLAAITSMYVKVHGFQVNDTEALRDSQWS